MIPYFNKLMRLIFGYDNFREITVAVRYYRNFSKIDFLIPVLFYIISLAHYNMESLIKMWFIFHTVLITYIHPTSNMIPFSFIRLN
jgi:hypothetical protein